MEVKSVSEFIEKGYSCSKVSFSIAELSTCCSVLNSSHKMNMKTLISKKPGRIWKFLKPDLCNMTYIVHRNKQQLFQNIALWIVKMLSMTKASQNVTWHMYRQVAMIVSNNLVHNPDYG